MESEKNPARKKEYMNLYLDLRRKIEEGIYTGGMRLPSKRTMAADYNVSVITVQHAMELLEDEGYILSRERSGYYVIYQEDEFLTGDRPEALKELESEKDMEKAPSVPEIPDIEETYYDAAEEFPFGVYARTVRRVLSEKQEEIFRKSENPGLRPLREAIARYLGRARNMQVSPEQIVIGSGAEYLYGLIAMILGDGSVIALEDPSYEKIRRIYSTHGLRLKMLKMGHHGIRREELLRCRADAMHVTPYHSYPSGVSATVSKKMEYLRWAEKCKALLIEDDYDSEFSMLGKNEDTLFSMEPEHTVIYLNTFSRTISPSVRIGYMVLPKQRAGAMMRAIGFYSCTVPVLEQMVLTELLNNGDFERHLNRVRRKRRKQGK